MSSRARTGRACAGDGRRALVPPSAGAACDDGGLALAVAVAVVPFELLGLAWLRWRFFHTGFLRSFASVTLGGVVIATLSAALGTAA